MLQTNDAGSRAASSPELSVAREMLDSPPAIIWGTRRQGSSAFQPATRSSGTARVRYQGRPNLGGMLNQDGVNPFGTSDLTKMSITIDSRAVACRVQTRTIENTEAALELDRVAFSRLPARLLRLRPRRGHSARQHVGAPVKIDLDIHIAHHRIGGVQWGGRQCSRPARRRRSPVTGRRCGDRADFDRSACVLRG